MPDFIDQMQEQEERRLAAIERFNQQESFVEVESASECDECGNSIPKARQLAVRGCRLCIECQSVNEAKAKHRMSCNVHH